MERITLETTLREFQLQQRVRQLELEIRRLSAQTLPSVLDDPKHITTMDFTSELPPIIKLFPVSEAHLTYGPLGWQVSARAKSGSSADWLAVSDYIEQQVIAKLTVQDTAELLTKIYSRGLGLIADLVKKRTGQKR